MQIRTQESRDRTEMGGQPLLSAAAITDRGRVRRANEDAFVSRPESGVFIVCDGMGGAAAGETASRLAADTAANVLVTSGHSDRAMREAVRQANTAVYERARQDPQLEGMGTTLVALTLGETAVYIAHVGDSRCYRWRDGVLQRLTQDHSLVEEQVRIGRMTREQARRSPMQNVITRAVGTRSEVVADVQELPVQRGDVFLLASDGLTRELSDAALSAILAASGDDLQLASERMVAGANAEGGRDNVTCVLVRAGV